MSPTAGYLSMMLWLLMIWSIIGSMTAEALHARGNGPKACYLGGLYWPIVWLYAALRGLSRLMDSADDVKAGRSPR